MNLKNAFFYFFWTPSPKRGISKTRGRPTDARGGDTLAQGNPHQGPTDTRRAISSLELQRMVTSPHYNKRKQGKLYNIAYVLLRVIVLDIGKCCTTSPRLRSLNRRKLRQYPSTISRTTKSRATKSTANVAEPPASGLYTRLVSPVVAPTALTSSLRRFSAAWRIRSGLRN